MDMIDQIGGWKSVGSIGNSYGHGYHLLKIRENIEDLNLTVDPYLSPYGTIA